MQRWAQLISDQDQMRSKLSIKMQIMINIRSTHKNQGLIKIKSDQIKNITYQSTSTLRIIFSSISTSYQLYKSTFNQDQTYINFTNQVLIKINFFKFQKTAPENFKLFLFWSKITYKAESETIRSWYMVTIFLCLFKSLLSQLFYN